MNNPKKESHQKGIYEKRKLKDNKNLTNYICSSTQQKVQAAFENKKTLFFVVKNPRVISKLLKTSTSYMQVHRKILHKCILPHLLCYYFYFIKVTSFTYISLSFYLHAMMHRNKFPNKKYNYKLKLWLSLISNFCKKLN